MQVILLQEGGGADGSGNQQAMYQPQQLTGQQQPQQQIIQAPAPASAPVAQVIQASVPASAPATQVIQAPTTIQATSDIIQDPNVQAQIMAQASSDAMVIQASTPSVNSGSTSIIETAFSQATNQAASAAQATIIDGSGNRILVADETQIPMQLMTSSASAPIILSNEQAQILIAGTSQQRRPKTVQQQQKRAVPTIVSAKGNRPGRSLISPAARNLVASQRGGTIQVTTTNPRSLPAALQPSPQQLLISSPTQITSSVNVEDANKDAMAAFESVENTVMEELVSGTAASQDEEVVGLREAQELSDKISAEEQISQAERDLLQAAKDEQEKQDNLDEEVPMPQDDMLQIDETPSAADQNIMMPETTENVTPVISGIPDEASAQAQVSIPNSDIPIPAPEEQAPEPQSGEQAQPEEAEPSVPEFTAVSIPEAESQSQVPEPMQAAVTDAPTIAEPTMSEPAMSELAVPVPITTESVASEPVTQSNIISDSTVNLPPAEISVSLAQPDGAEVKIPESSSEQTQDHVEPMDQAGQLNGNIFANEEEDMETDDPIQAVVVTDVPVQPQEAAEKRH